MTRTALCFLLLALSTAGLFLLDLMTGDVTLPAADVWAALTGSGDDALTAHIVRSVRLVRGVVAVLVGLSLSVSGLQMQTVFRNPLADPYLLGVSSGASLGVALFILGIPLLGLSGAPWLQSVGVAGAGWVGSAAILLGVAFISRRVKNIMGVLILGVMTGYVAGALIQVLQYLSAAEQLKLFTLWSMGSLGHVTAAKLWVMLPVIAAGLLLATYTIKALNLLFSNLAADPFDSMNFCLKHMQIPLDIFRKFRKNTFCPKRLSAPSSPRRTGCGGSKIPRKLPLPRPPPQGRSPRACLRGTPLRLRRSSRSSRKSEGCRPRRAPNRG